MENKTDILDQPTTYSGTTSSRSITKGDTMSKTTFKIERNCYWCQELLADHEDYLIMKGNFYCPRCPEYKQEIKNGYLKKYPFFN
jgi:Zn finger protein HypA/HybF involved in hydrogenase expression